MLGSYYDENKLNLALSSKVFLLYLYVDSENTAFPLHTEILFMVMESTLYSMFFTHLYFIIWSRMCFEYELTEYVFLMWRTYVHILSKIVAINAISR